MGAAEERRWANEYETIYILRPNTSADEADKVAHRVADVLGRLNGTITKVDNWGKRRLAYTIKKFTRGIFVYVRYVAYNDAVAELERNLRMLDPVIRYQTIVLYKGIDPADIEIDPEEVKFLPIEETEDEEEPSFEQQLGLSTREEEKPSEPEAEASEEGEGDEGDSEESDSKPEAKPEAKSDSKSEAKSDSSDEDEEEKAEKKKSASASDEEE